MIYAEFANFDAPADVTCIAFSKDGSLLAGGFSKMIRIWRVESGSILHHLCLHDCVTFVVWGPNSTLYCGSASGYLVALTIDEEKQMIDAYGFRASEYSLDFIAVDSLGLRLAIGARDQVTLWNAGRDIYRLQGQSWTLSKNLPSPPDQGRVVKITSIFWTPRAAGLIVSYLHQGIVTWDIDTETRLSTISLNFVPSGDLSHDGELFVVPNRNRGFDVFHVETSVHSATFADPSADSTGHNTFYPALFIHRGKWLLCGGIGKATMWHIDTHNKTQALHAADPSTPITIMAANLRKIEGYSRARIATVSRGRKITIWQAGAPSPSKPTFCSRSCSFTDTWVVAMTVCLVICGSALWARFRIQNVAVQS